MASPLEALLALRDLAGDLVEITLVAPEEKFSYRLLSVAQPFSLGHSTHYSLDELADELGAHLVPDRVAEEVAANAKVVHCGGGITVPYDALILALGAQSSRAYPTGTSFAGGDDAQEAVHGLLADLEQGYGRRVAFVAPTAVAWTLPLYELAIMTARELWSMGMDGVRFTLVTPEPRPLAAFGPIASAAIADLLERERIGFEGSAYADVRDGSIVLGPDGRRLEVDRVVSLPRLTGPGLPRGSPRCRRVHPGRPARRRAEARGRLRRGRRHGLPDQAGRSDHPTGRRGGRGYLYGRDEAELVRAGHAGHTGHTAIDVALER